MPEIAEITRIVHFLRKHLVGRRIAAVQTQNDDIVYGKVGTSGDAFATAMRGKTVVDAKQQGKYFYLVMDSKPHPVMHFGMTGWIKFSNDESGYYKPQKEKDASAKNEEWPPRFWKFNIQMEGEPRVEAAFVDARRLGRIRLVDAAGEDLRKTTPLKENGPDPVIDKDILTEDWLLQKLRSKRVPVKALLLDQANISGVGNWVGDEILYNAKIHPEQYSNTLSDAQAKQLHKSLMYVCTTACDLLGDSDKFPEGWLMKHRWNKGKNAESRLPNGDKIAHLTVGGRTSAIVPSVQRKTGPVAGDVGDSVKDEAEDNEPKAQVKTKTEKSSGKAGKSARGAKGAREVNGGPSTTGRKRKSAASEPVVEEEDAKGTSSKRKKESNSADDDAPRRRSARVSKG